MDSAIFVNSEFDGATFTLPGSSTCLLLFHGFTATTHEVRNFAEMIHSQRGFTVHTPLLPGHGTTPIDLSQTDFSDWLHAADNEYEDLRSRYSEVILGGESMGGLLSLYLLSQHAESTAAIIFAPALIIPNMWLVNFMQHFVFSTKKKIRPAAPGYLPWQGYKVNPLRAVAQLGKLQSFIKDRLSKITQPVLVFQGLDDETIDIRSSRIVINSIRSNVKELVEVDKGQHCVLLDAQRDAVYTKTIKFIDEIRN